MISEEKEKIRTSKIMRNINFDKMHNERTTRHNSY